MFEKEFMSKMITPKKAASCIERERNVETVFKKLNVSDFLIRGHL